MNQLHAPMNRRILVIDDNRAIHDDFRKILAPGPACVVALDATEEKLFGTPPLVIPRQRYEIDSAYQGEDGVMRVSQARENGHPYAMAFVDVRMPPGMDGVETTLKIWEIDPDIQVVLCTAYSDYSWEEMFEKIGNCDRLVILKKPFDSVEALQLAHAFTEKWWLLQLSRQKLGEMEERVAERTRELQLSNLALQRQQSELQALFDLIPAMILFKDTDNRILRANKRVAEHTDRLIGEIEGEAADDVFPKFSGRFFEKDLEVIRSRRPQMGIIDAIPDRSGGESWIQTDKVPVFDGDGEVVGVVVMSQDITERRAAEECVRQNESLLRIAGRTARLGGWAVDLATSRVTWSDEVCMIHDMPFGTRPTLAQGLEFYAPPSREPIAKAFAGCAWEGIPFDLELEIITAMERRVWVRSTGEAQRDSSGVVTHVQGALQDITERKNLEQQVLRAQRMESIGTLAGGIAHDLNNVLAPIMMSIDLLSVNEMDPKRINILSVIKDSAKRGAELVEQVLSFARGKKGQQTQVEVSRLLNETANIVRETFPKDIRLVENISTDLWTVRGDPTQLHQVLINLCVNARDAMPDGGTLTLTAENLALDEHRAGMGLDVKPGRHVFIRLSDTGTGIPRDVMERIFDPFFTTKEIGNGTGLGLSTSLAIIKTHGGSIHCQSEQGSGTEFHLYLPALEVVSAVLPDPAVGMPRGNGELIMVVDDESAVRQITRQTLEFYGYRVVIAVDGAEAVATYARRKQEISVVLTDMMMPVMDGLATIRNLRKMNPAVAIIAASGLCPSEHLAGASLQGVRHFLPKPYAAGSLLTTLGQVLEPNRRRTDRPGSREIRESINVG